jgi:hypothetical protein
VAIPAGVCIEARRRLKSDTTNRADDAVVIERLLAGDEAAFANVVAMRPVTVQ